MAVFLAVNNSFFDDGGAPSNEEMKEILEKVVSIYEKDSIQLGEIELRMDANTIDFLLTEVYVLLYDNTLFFLLRFEVIQVLWNVTWKIIYRLFLFASSCFLFFAK